MRRSANVVFGLWIASTAIACGPAQSATVGAPIAAAGSTAGLLPRGGTGGTTSPIGTGVSGTGGAAGSAATSAPSTQPMMGLDLFATPACGAIQAEPPGMSLAAGAAGSTGAAGAAGSSMGGGAAAGSRAGAGGSGGTGGARALMLAGSGGASAAGSGGTSGAAGTGAVSAGAGGASAGGGSSGATATFDDVYQLLICEGCNNSYCHGTIAGFSVSDSRSELYTTLLGPDGQGAPTGDAVSLGKCTGMKRVIPGDPDHSLLYLKVSQHQSCGDAMPPPGQDRMLSGFLNAREVSVIRSWIAGGAKK